MPNQLADKSQIPIADGKGPIPEFPAARLDPETGRLLPMSQEELETRRDAAMRMLAAIGEITDETDTDERWKDFMRAFDESHRLRPQFDGMY